ncbi:hypothetical protein RYX36_037212 [Vicia faba]
MKSHIAHEMEHDVGVNKLQQLHLGASNSVTSEQISPLLTIQIEGSQDIQHLQDTNKELPKLLDYASYLIHLAVFGILGVLTRYTLDKLFGPSVGHVTSDQTILYLDLPSNMVGSFLMGWFGVVFKEDISNVSEYLAVALTTGYLGSLTTFSGSNLVSWEIGSMLCLVI